MLIINKQKGWTSHDVVAKLRSILSIQKIGHTGTLDPDATGVLTVCIGRATRLAQYTNEFDKEYKVVMRLGISTDTQDAAGRVIKETAEFNISLEQIEEAFRKFTGKISQVPPMYSAVKVKGVPLYRHARKGKEITREPREINITEIKLLDYSGEFAGFEVTCSKGTYIRTLCADIGDFLGVGAHMFSLERTRSGDFSIKDSITIDDAEGLNRADRLETKLRRLEQITGWMPSATINSYGNSLVRDGRALDMEAVEGIKGDFSRDDTIAVVDNCGVLKAIGKAICGSNEVRYGSSEKIVKIERVLL
ncbi:MAG: tRNA pseudouridine(55) synthase TruB [Nitrospirae bacterium]|nr:tRNA pseudouridine(55) synthase TruB [Nitrospirota bacterium]